MENKVFEIIFEENESQTIDEFYEFLKKSFDIVGWNDDEGTCKLWIKHRTVEKGKPGRKKKDLGDEVDLLRWVNQTSIRYVAKQLGVSRTTIRNRIRHEREKELAEQKRIQEKIKQEMEEEYASYIESMEEYLKEEKLKESQIEESNSELIGLFEFTSDAY